MVGILFVVLLITSVLGSKLHNVAGQGKLIKVQGLLISNTDVNEKDENGNTPLFRAVWNRQLPIAELPIKFSIDSKI